MQIPFASFAVTISLSPSLISARLLFYPSVLFTRVFVNLQSNCWHNLKLLLSVKHTKVKPPEMKLVYSWKIQEDPVNGSITLVNFRTQFSMAHFISSIVLCKCPVPSLQAWWTKKTRVPEDSIFGRMSFIA